MSFQGFQRQVHERLTQLELVNNQYRRLARENRTDRASQLKAMVHEGNRRWDVLHRRVAAILRRLKVRQENVIAEKIASSLSITGAFPICSTHKAVSDFEGMDGLV